MVQQTCDGHLLQHFIWKHLILHIFVALQLEITQICIAGIILILVFRPSRKFFHLQVVSVTMERLERSHWLAMSHC